MDGVWDFVIRELPSLESAARRYSRGTQCSSGELLSEAVQRIPRLFETHNPERGTLRGYVLMSCYRYMRKWVRRTRKITKREDGETLYPDSVERLATHEDTVDEREIIDQYFRGMSEDQRYVVTGNVLLDIPLQELAWDLGIAKGLVAKLKKRAIADMRSREWYVPLCQELMTIISSRG